MEQAYWDHLGDLSASLTYPAATCQHLRRPNFGDFRSPLLTDIRKASLSCLLCLVTSTVVAKMLPELAASEATRVRLDVLETQGRTRLCVAVHVGEPREVIRKEMLEAWSHTPAPCPLLPAHPQTPPRTDSDHAISQIKSWMTICLTNHFTCSTRPFPMPRRVLQILQGGQKVRLHLTKGEVAAYLTLSHCWGSTPPLQTTKANIGSHLHNIPLDTLPQLFRDAITITSRLGYKYLWIDSLCIIQDSPPDWDRESSLMASIYANSTLTLAATKAPSSSSSLFTSHPSTAITLPSFTFHARFATKHIPRHPNPTSFPLLTRAWVYQERLLSPRVLHFGPDELAWECNDSIRCQCGYFDRTPDPRYLPLADERRVANVKAQHTSSLLAATASGATGTTPARNRLAARWRRMVTEYSALGLTRPSDRLPALSGLAKQMRGVGGGRYLAGLWEDSFFRDLLWVPVSANKQGERNAEWLAPTWSWASQRGAVRYTNGERMKIGGLGIYQPAELGNSGDVVSELVGGSCELVAAECVPAGVDDTGMVASGWVRVGGFVVEMEPAKDFLSTKEGRWVVTVHGIKSRGVYWDEAPQAVEEGGEFWKDRYCLLRIGCIPAFGEMEPYDEWSLLLRQVGEGVFERCGLVCRSKGIRDYGPDEMQEFCEHARETSPWFGRLKEAVDVTIV